MSRANPEQLKAIRENYGVDDEEMCSQRFMTSISGVFKAYEESTRG